MINVLLSSPDGGGFSEYVSAENGITVDKFLETFAENKDPDRLKIRVNRRPVQDDQVLEEGDRVSLSYVKLEGAM